MVKRKVVFAAAAVVLVLGGVGLGFALNASAGRASAQQPPNDAGSPTPQPWGWMNQHMQDGHGPEAIQDMREHMDAVHGEGSFDRMHEQGGQGCAGTPASGSSDEVRPGNGMMSGAGRMMGGSAGQPRGGMMW